MKTIKSILSVATLVCATVVSTMSAQQPAQPAQEHEWGVEIGDSVLIKRECIEYSTGERPSVWVWDKVHTVRQLGTKKHPDGVLLMNIYSWICDSCLTNLTPHDKQPADNGQADQGDQGQTDQGGEQQDTIPAVDNGQQAKDTIPVDDNKGDQQVQPGDSAKSQIKKTQYDRFTIGARAGVASLLHQPLKSVDAKWGIGADAVLDLQYAHYWAKEGRPVDLGIIVGLGIGYAQGSFSGNKDTVYTDGEIKYHVTAKDIRETDRQIQLEVPVMFSLIHNSGFFFNVGPKFMIPVYSFYKQSLNPDATITAVFPGEGVTLDPNEVVTGKYQGEQPTESNGIQFKINVMLTAELGYEWILKNGDSFGLGAFANYSVYNNYKNQFKNAAAGSPDSRPSLLDITAPSNEGEGDIAHLNVLSATRTYADKLGYFDVGIKLAYHFNFPKKQYVKYKESKLF